MFVLNNQAQEAIFAPEMPVNLVFVQRSIKEKIQKKSVNFWTHEYVFNWKITSFPPSETNYNYSSVKSALRDCPRQDTESC